MTCFHESATSIDPQDLDPNTGRPYSNYSSPSLDTSFHDGEMDVDDAPEEILHHALLLAYRAALTEQGNPGLLISRMRREAAALDARSRPSWEEAAEFYDKAAYREEQGETALADDFLRRAKGAETHAAKLDLEAFNLRLRAAQIEAQMQTGAALMQVAS